MTGAIVVGSDFNGAEGPAEHGVMTKSRVKYEVGER